MVCHDAAPEEGSRHLHSDGVSTVHEQLHADPLSRGATGQKSCHTDPRLSADPGSALQCMEHHRTNRLWVAHLGRANRPDLQDVAGAIREGCVMKRPHSLILNDGLGGFRAPMARRRLIGPSIQLRWHGTRQKWPGNLNTLI